MAGLVAGGLASGSLSFCGRSARTRRTVRSNPADGPQFISKSHSETVRFWSPIYLFTADGPRYRTGRSAVHFWTITQNQTFSGIRLEFHRWTVRASRADGPRLL